MKKSVTFALIAVPLLLLVLVAGLLSLNGLGADARLREANIIVKAWWKLLPSRDPATIQGVYDPRFKSSELPTWYDELRTVAKSLDSSHPSKLTLVSKEYRHSQRPPIMLTYSTSIKSQQYLVKVGLRSEHEEYYISSFELDKVLK